jgi:hypothetical protein
MESWKRIDKYQINMRKLLGQGSYASVYLGDLPRLVNRSQSKSSRGNYSWIPIA